MANITTTDVTKFYWRNIFTRFGLPKIMVMDHGPQFDSVEMKEYLAGLGVIARYSSVMTPSSNGLAERTNRTLLRGLRTRLKKAKGAWVEQLHHVLWSCRTTPSETTGETPYSLAYGAEAVIPIELDLPSARVQFYQEEENEGGLRESLDAAEERREIAMIRTAAMQQKAARTYNAKVKTKTFSKGDLVLRRVAASDPKLKQQQGKLAPTWEGPHRVRAVVKPGTYELENLQGAAFARTWNSINLRKYYQ